MIAINLTFLTEPKEAPSDVKAYSISSSEIRVTWKPPNPGPGRPKGYEVHYNYFVLHVYTHFSLRMCTIVVKMWEQYFSSKSFHSVNRSATGKIWSRKSQE